MWYVEVLIKTYNEGDRTFYDAINFPVYLTPKKVHCIVKVIVNYRGTNIPEREKPFQQTTYDQKN